MSTKATISTKGHLIDPHCEHAKDGVLVEYQGSVYSCTLNQTNIGSNNNKFYIMQIIKIGNDYVVYIRYGRIGVIGKPTYKKCNQNTAIAFFERQFQSKTGNRWSNRHDFEKRPGKYYMADIECVDVSEEENDENDTDKDGIELDKRITNFLKLMSNTTYMKNTLIQLEIDVEKMPLGKISQNQIDDAYEIINKINAIIKKSNNQEKLIKLSSDFYTLIPIACGMRAPPVINSTKLIGKNINLLNELSQMVFGTKAVIKLKKNKTNLIKFYNDLHTDIVPLDKTDEMYQLLESYLKNSKAPTHNFDYEILEILQIDREGERDLYDTFSIKITNKTLLFHGTRVSNLIGILQNGLVCDPSV